MLTAVSDLEKLRTEYLKYRPAAEAFLQRIKSQLEECLERDGVSLAVPLQARVKDWNSITAKLVQPPTTIAHVGDLIGLRVILLFRSDCQRVCKRLEKDFKVLAKEDAGERLGESQFGYTSIHYSIKPRPTRRKPRRLESDNLFSAEIQVRTIAQHCWAAASHILQYKHSGGVPEDLRRSLNRVSALLETIDLEFERFLSERTDYLRRLSHSSLARRSLDVDVLAKVLDQTWPRQNKTASEDYAALLQCITYMGLSNAGKLITVLTKNRAAVMNQERRAIKGALLIGQLPPASTRIAFMVERAKRGVYFSHFALTTIGLRLEFPNKWDGYLVKAARDVAIAGISSMP